MEHYVCKTLFESSVIQDSSLTVFLMVLAMVMFESSVIQDSSLTTKFVIDKPNAFESSVIQDSSLTIGQKYVAQDAVWE